jgi:hypothetical protein
VAKKEHKEHDKEQMRKKKVKVEKLEHEPDHCIHCAKDPFVFIQIEMRLCENDDIYYDRDDYEKGPVAYKSARRKRTGFQYAAFILSEGVNYRKPHSTCEDGVVRALSPLLDRKSLGYKKT